MGNRTYASEIFAVASLLEARGANPYRVRAYRRAALRLLRMDEDVATHLDERGELALPGLGQRLRRKLGELVRTGRLSFHDELIAAEPRAIRTLLTVPGIGPKTADRLVGEAHVRGLKSLARAARQGRLQRMRGVGAVRERAWGEAAESLLAAEPAAGPRAETRTASTADAQRAA
jgi:DNA polymerase (family 10)